MQGSRFLTKTQVGGGLRCHNFSFLIHDSVVHLGGLVRQASVYAVFYASALHGANSALTGPEFITSLPGRHELVLSDPV